MYLCVYVFMYLCICVFMCLCIYVFNYVWIYVFMYLCMYVFMCFCLPIMHFARSLHFFPRAPGGPLPSLRVARRRGSSVDAVEETARSGVLPSASIASHTPAGELRDAANPFACAVANARPPALPSPGRRLAQIPRRVSRFGIHEIINLWIYKIKINRCAQIST